MNTKQNNLTLFRAPYLLKDRDVIVVVCNRCHIYASVIIDNEPLCVRHAKEVDPDIITGFCV